MSNINASPSPSPQAASVSNPNSSVLFSGILLFSGRKTEGCEQPVAKPSMDTRQLLTCPSEFCPPGAQKLVHPTGGRRDPRKVASPEDVVPTSGPLKEPKIGTQVTPSFIGCPGTQKMVGPIPVGPKSKKVITYAPGPISILFTLYCQALTGRFRSHKSRQSKDGHEPITSETESEYCTVSDHNSEHAQITRIAEMTISDDETANHTVPHANSTELEQQYTTPILKSGRKYSGRKYSSPSEELAPHRASSLPDERTSDKTHLTHCPRIWTDNEGFSSVLPSNLSEARSSTHKDATSEDATSIKTAHDTSTLITFLSHSAPVPDKGDKDSGVPAFLPRYLIHQSFNDQPIPSVDSHGSPLSPGQALAFLEPAFAEEHEAMVKFSIDLEDLVDLALSKLQQDGRHSHKDDSVSKSSWVHLPGSYEPCVGGSNPIAETQLNQPGSNQAAPELSVEESEVDSSIIDFKNTTGRRATTTSPLPHDPLISSTSIATTAERWSFFYSRISNTVHNKIMTYNILIQASIVSLQAVRVNGLSHPVILCIVIYILRPGIYTISIYDTRPNNLPELDGLEGSNMRLTLTAMFQRYWYCVLQPSLPFSSILNSVQVLFLSVQSLLIPACKLIILIFKRRSREKLLHVSLQFEPEQSEMMMCYNVVLQKKKTHHPATRFCLCQIAVCLLIITPIPENLLIIPDGVMGLIGSGRICLIGGDSTWWYVILQHPNWTGHFSQSHSLLVRLNALFD
ncbi:hypothetical protein VP01_2964g2 [Puccinia sorghi]|uniref:Uncharacterized protein n=1 Tax=Puccinia sorghi TaxID=27349 RepID=A0A0L6V0R1_9BASI|nr:hypothetical protein VP01_2964g2 [Puccinia sorghi]